MRNLRVARRYAEAIIELAFEQRTIDRVADDFTLLRQTISRSREFVAFLKSPVISKEKKESVLAELFRSRLSDMTMGFLSLLTEKAREDVLPEIVEEFFRIRDEKLGITTVQVRAATELTREQHRTIQRRFEEISRKKVQIDFAVDGGLRGGVVARLGDTVFDGSVQRQLELLRGRFAE